MAGYRRGRREWFLAGRRVFHRMFHLSILKVVREKKMNKIIAYAFALVAIFDNDVRVIQDRRFLERR